MVPLSRRPTVLYVDADAAAGAAFAARYGDNWSISTAQTSRAALEAARTTPPTLAVVCLGPRAGPIDLACASNLASRSRVLLVSAHARDYSQTELIDVGAIEFLGLPVEPRVLEVALARLTSGPP